MKTESYEFVQRIPSHYVGEDCFQVMIPHYDRISTILNADGMIYHYKPNSKTFVNNYLTDKRKVQFPYSDIPIHTKRVGLRKLVMINQILEFSKVYLQISNGVITEQFGLKDGNEALLAVKNIVPSNKITKILTRDEFDKFIEKANGNVFDLNGGIYSNDIIPSEEEILEQYKKLLIKSIERTIFNNVRDRIPDSVQKLIDRGIERTTIEDVPQGIGIDSNVVLVFKSNDNNKSNEIEQVKIVNIYFEGKNRYKVEIYDAPITIYTLEHLKQLEQLNLIKTKEPKIRKSLNSGVNEDYIKEEQTKVLKFGKKKK